MHGSAKKRQRSERYRDAGSVAGDEACYTGESDEDSGVEAQGAQVELGDEVAVMGHATPPPPRAPPPPARGECHWGERLNAVRSFLAANRGRYPSASSADEGERNLAKWVSKQRQYIKGKPAVAHVTGRTSRRLTGTVGSLLRRQRREALTQLPGWTWHTRAPPRQLQGAGAGVSSWDARFEKLRGFLQDNAGRYPSNSSACPAECSLNEWVRNQRKARKVKEKSPSNGVHMTEVRSRRLQELPGWVWHVHSSWDSRLEALRGFLQANSGNYPKKRKTSNPEVDSLARWVSHQRSARKGSGRLKMTEARAVQLELLPAWTW